jgi:2-amino-4-hydroxy-6-hydroxymethyldihydropteridine diphosphokinase
VDRIAREPGFSLRRVSLAYDTEPIGPAQPRYLNAVAQVGTLLTPRGTLRKLQAIEEALGRVRREHWGAREIDLDLLLYGDRELNETGLVVPHPFLERRAFALIPLAEIAPLVVHPGAKQTAAQLVGALSAGERAQVRPFRAIRRPLPEPDGDAGEQKG